MSWTAVMTIEGEIEPSMSPAAVTLATDVYERFGHTTPPQQEEKDAYVARFKELTYAERLGCWSAIFDSLNACCDSSMARGIANMFHDLMIEMFGIPSQSVSQNPIIKKITGSR